MGWNLHRYSALRGAALSRLFTVTPLRIGSGPVPWHGMTAASDRFRASRLHACGALDCTPVPTHPRALLSASYRPITEAELREAIRDFFSFRRDFVCHNSIGKGQTCSDAIFPAESNGAAPKRPNVKRDTLRSREAKSSHEREQRNAASLNAKARQNRKR
jgi:hypothetical protein